ncbi:GH25 family lysozyme [uncultured Duncaniella sp.]|uniref:glycoside hydrolase family 25 protein n=1 Tax=uncultured Duncaniella sp. TaxID=2768039 RepID=UPI0023CEB5CA|nr:GH25 family lysozyme [uncultured Duncaniella sp.]MDE5665865.1 hypothetical protein [Duncaniella sp.]MDE5960970.1 hypothetical protein [Duncaniella sp.]MDE6187602.1 hypothetical protein [Duncaniella sp.]
MKPLLHTLFIMILTATLTACGKGGDTPAQSYPDRSKFKIIGIDISAHNGEIDFRKVAADGISFVIIKATEGGTFKDRRFIDNLREARKAGLKVGAYHFFRFDTPGYMQGLNFLNSLQSRELDLPLIIDIEEWANPNSQPTPMVLNRLTEMIDHLESHGHRVMLYTNKNGFARFVRGRLEGYPLWICSLIDEPHGIEWKLWQGTHNGRVNGIDHPVDINAFAGTEAEWAEFLSPTGETSSSDMQ